MRALAEAPQLLMHYADIEYNYIMSWDYYDKEWQEVKPQIPFKQLPMIVVNDKHDICQSIAILNFIENIAGLKLKDLKTEQSTLEKIFVNLVREKNEN